MKLITVSTEDQATAICAALPQYRAVRAVKMYHKWVGENKIQWYVEVETFSAEEVVGGPVK